MPSEDGNRKEIQIIGAAKDLCLKKKPGEQSISQWWASIIHDERFEMVRTCATAEMFDHGLNKEQMDGAKHMLYTLEGLCDGEPRSTPFPSPGLHHKMPSAVYPPQPDKKT